MPRRRTRSWPTSSISTPSARLEQLLQALRLARQRRLIRSRPWEALLQQLQPLLRQQLRLPHQLLASAWEDWVAHVLPLQAALQRTTCSASSLVEAAAAVRLLQPLHLPQQQQRRARTLRWRRLAAAYRCHPSSQLLRSRVQQLRLWPWLRRRLPPTHTQLQHTQQLQLRIRSIRLMKLQLLPLQLQPAQPRPQEPCPHRTATATAMATAMVVAIHLQRWEAVEAEAPLLHPAPRLHLRRRVLRRRIHLQLWKLPLLRHRQATTPNHAPAAALPQQVRLRLAQLRLADALQMTRPPCWTT